MLKSLKSVIDSAKVGVSRAVVAIKSKSTALVAAGLTAVATSGAMAEGEESTIAADLFNAAKTEVLSAADLLAAFLTAMIVIPLAFFVWKLVRKGL